ncbi:MAG: hypothetical protein R2681_12595 [Pyrinomonadaceae bacterium]
MSENETQTTAEESAPEVTTEATETNETAVEAAAESTETVEAAATEAEAENDPEEISYHAVEKEGEITAIWEMQGQKHLRTIDPRSTEGQKIFSLFTSDIHETDSPPLASEASS